MKSAPSTSSAPTPHDLPASLVLVGGGKMGAAMLEGWLALGLDPRTTAVIDPVPSAALSALGTGHDVRVARSADELDGHPVPDVLALAIKPQSLPDAAPSLLRLAGPDTLVLSILAGKTTRDLARAIPGTAAIVRAMPNLPASIRQGATGAFATHATLPRQRAVAHALLAGVGLVEWVDDESLIDAVTAMSGSGPAYLFLLTECLAQAGIASGLEPGLSERLALKTITGAAALLAASHQEASTLRQAVTSPGGTTAAAMEILMGEPGLSGLLTAAVDAARRRAEELSG